MTVEHNRDTDFVIVCAGAAGCVLANRLSEDASKTVVLLEAGHDFGPRGQSAAILDGGFRSHNIGEYFISSPATIAAPSTLLPDGRTSRFRQARIMGGGSSVNGMIVQRGTVDDYREWEEFGIRGWDWEEIAKYFCRLETDVDRSGPLHGRSGPMPVRRAPEDELSAFSKRIRMACAKLGIRQSEDLCTDNADCVGVIPMNIQGGMRVSCASAYLGDEVRARRNLQIRADSQVTRLSIDNMRAVGVYVDTPAGEKLVPARNVILCAGVLESPVILMRSGVGNARDLERSGVRVCVDRPGVGRELRNHAHISAAVWLKPEARQKQWAPACNIGARYSSNIPGCEPTDMMLSVWERVPGALTWDPFCRRIGTLMVTLNKSYSKGSIKLNTADAGAAPQISFNILSDQRDLLRLIDGLRMIARVAGDDDVRKLIGDPFIPVPNKGMEYLFRNDMVGMAASAGFAALGSIGASRSALLRRAGLNIDQLVVDECLATNAIMALAQAASHATASCRMGSLDDPYAVTDERCRVIGVRDLRIVDASIIPSTLRAGTHFPIIMVAEKAADMIKEDLSS